MTSEGEEEAIDRPTEDWRGESAAHRGGRVRDLIWKIELDATCEKGKLLRPHKGQHAVR